MNELNPVKNLPKFPLEPWKPLGVYRTFPFPISPLPPFTPRVKWKHPSTGKVY